MSTFSSLKTQAICVNCGLFVNQLKPLKNFAGTLCDPFIEPVQLFGQKNKVPLCQICRHRPEDSYRKESALDWLHANFTRFCEKSEVKKKKNTKFLRYYRKAVTVLASASLPISQPSRFCDYFPFREVLHFKSVSHQNNFIEAIGRLLTALDFLCPSRCRFVSQGWNDPALVADVSLVSQISPQPNDKEEDDSSEEEEEDIDYSSSSEEERTIRSQKRPFSSAFSNEKVESPAERFVRQLVSRAPADFVDFLPFDCDGALMSPDKIDYTVFFRKTSPSLRDIVMPLKSQQPCLFAELTPLIQSQLSIVHLPVIEEKINSLEKERTSLMKPAAIIVNSSQPQPPQNPTILRDFCRLNDRIQSLQIISSTLSALK